MFSSHRLRFRLVPTLGLVRGVTLLVLAVAVALLVGAPAAVSAASGSMRYVTFQRPAGSGCTTTTGTNAAATATGIGWDGSHVLVTCWADEAIDRYTQAGGLVDVVAVQGLPGPGIGGISWDGDHHVWWACGLDGTKPSLSQQVGYITPDHSWHAASIAPHGCVNNVTYRAGLVYADGAYVNSQATSTTVDVGAVRVGAGGQLQLPAKLAAKAVNWWSPHTSGNLFSDTGQLEWQADQFGTTKRVWHNGVLVLSGTLRYEQLACNRATGTVYLKWFNQNRFGLFDHAGC